MLEANLRLLSFCGCWRPSSWSSNILKTTYGLYSFLVMFLVYTFSLSQFLDILYVDNIDDLTENSYMLLTIFVACCKLTNLLVYRNSIRHLVDLFHRDPHVSLNPVELEIQTKYDKLIRIKTIQYTIMIETSVVSTVLNSLLTDLRNQRLTYRAWIPYDYSSTTIFRLTYSYQMISMFVAAFIHVASDAFLCGLLLQTCCQIDILEARLRGIRTNDSDALRKCIRHHDHIYRLAAMINVRFMPTILSQFVVSTLVLCVSLVQLLKKDILSTEFFVLILYLSTLLTQIFLYCWYGNEVKLKSMKLSETIFHVDWTELSEENKKILLFAMQRTGSPIEFNCAYIITVNLDSFVNLIKTSYSAYSILQNTQTS